LSRTICSIAWSARHERSDFGLIAGPAAAPAGDSYVIAPDNIPISFAVNAMFPVSEAEWRAILHGDGGRLLR
jgi:hypothetical protein